tara:strand:- start:506 stop:1342 length:837 start_codon:yes stop_codon:yes gene_type:complete
MSVENQISEELKRYADITDYVTLQETAQGSLSSTGSGFVDTQGTSDRLEAFNKRQRDMGEQEGDAPTDEEGDDAAGDDLEMGGDDLEMGDDDLEMGDEGGDEEIDLDMEGGDEEADVDMEGGEEDTEVEELDITDIVTMTKETGEKADAASTEITSQGQRITDLIGKLDSLETQLGSMDKILDQMNNLENKFTELKPETPTEKLELRYLDSGPFTQKPHEFWDEKNAELKKQPDKHEYVLTQDEVEDYSDFDIKTSWTPDEEEEQEEEEKFSVLGNKA